MSDDDLQISYTLKEVLGRLEGKSDRFANSGGAQVGQLMSDVTDLKHWRQELERKEQEKTEHRHFVWPTFWQATAAFLALAAVVVTVVSLVAK